ncbi:MAG: four helix bundle protein [Planctomycetaceae bacterium]|nr:four helix bundle protein [Planctomycetaceae bacterium]
MTKTPASVDGQTAPGKPADLKLRTKEFALRIIRLHAALPRTAVGRVLGDQLLRAGTSVGAQYREAMRSRSRAEFISKTQSALQELEEACYWVELIVESELIPERRLKSLHEEAAELLSMLAASVRTARSRK